LASIEAITITLTTTDASQRRTRRPRSAITTAAKKSPWTVERAVEVPLLHLAGLLVAGRSG